MILKEIIALLTIHYIADFIMQSDSMALNKSTSIKWLTIHATVYSVIWFVFGLGGGYDAMTINLFTLITFVCHWTTDYFTSRWSRRLHEKNKIHQFFLVIGLDQLLHYIQIFVTYKLLVG